MAKVFVVSLSCGVILPPLTVSFRSSFLSLVKNISASVLGGIIKCRDLRNLQSTRSALNGAFSSEMMDGMLERMGDITQHFPRRRIGEPAQMDSTLLYFLSPASEFVTGTYIKIDDGQGGR